MSEYIERFFRCPECQELMGYYDVITTDLSGSLYSCHKDHHYSPIKQRCLTTDEYVEWRKTSCTPIDELEELCGNKEEDFNK